MDRLILTEVKKCQDDDTYFVFEDMVRDILILFMRDDGVADAVKGGGGGSAGAAGVGSGGRIVPEEGGERRQQHKLGTTFGVEDLARVNLKGIYESCFCIALSPLRVSLLYTLKRSKN
jgi:hypothetical protein